MPSTDNIRNIASTIEGKVTTGQASNIVVNLKDSSATAVQLQERLAKYPIKGLEKVIVLEQSGNIVTFDGAGK